MLRVTVSRALQRLIIRWIFFHIYSQITGLAGRFRRASWSWFAPMLSVALVLVAQVCRRLAARAHPDVTRARPGRDEIIAERATLVAKESHSNPAAGLLTRTPVGTRVSYQANSGILIFDQLAHGNGAFYRAIIPKPKLHLIGPKDEPGILHRA